MNSYKYYYDNKIINKLLKSEYINIGNTDFNLNLFLILTDYINNSNTIFVTCPNLSISQKYYDAFINYLNEDDVLFFPTDELLTSEMLASSGDFLYERIYTMLSLLENRKRIVITNTNGIIKKIIPRDILFKYVFKLEKNQTVDKDKLLETLIESGYKRVHSVTKTGEFSKRGDIIDIFTLGNEKPYRLDFFDDEIETIKEFDVETQRSDKSELKEITISPVIEFIYNKDNLNKGIKEIKLFLENNEISDVYQEIINRDIDNLLLREETESLTRYIQAFYDQEITISDYVINKKIYFIDEGRIEETFNNIMLDYNEYTKHFTSSGEENYLSFVKLENIKPNVCIEGTKSIGKLDYKFDFEEISPYRNNINLILKDLRKYKNERKVLVSIKNQEHKDYLKRELFEEKIYYSEKTIEQSKENNIYFTNVKLPTVKLNDLDILIINEDTLFSIEEVRKNPKYKSIYKNAVKVSKYEDLNVGDYIVHYDYGVGRYLGIKTLTDNNIKRDYIYCEYANDKKLYVPIEKINSIMKYAAKEIPGIKLNEIGTSQWARTKEKVRKKIRDISDRLIKLYAKREKTLGFKYPEDDVLQVEFEADFPYELTPDQQKAIDLVKADMEKPYPMDRLICGDVGYGKTEIALRAAFKAVLAGKQVSLLCPTTILSEQHFTTFNERMDKYGIKVELVNRFVSTKKQNEIIEKIKTGEIDVLIGTHRLLNDVFKFKDLGLLIIDEEQRFGVVHKEKIKELKVNVDCMTLSATPIPRTLQMSMLGIKDLSLIETPPKNRYPIQTYVIPRSDSIIRDAIEKEISRNGQVFYLYNRVDDIDLMADKIKKLVPEANVCFAHGRMKSQDLENRILDFINKKYDVLVCTTIIETGIDIPSANTLLIHDATSLGLSQMYQIRGRVGRSNKIAYSYLMYDNKKHLTEESRERLEAIKQFNALGSGFKIAMRDLSIRGSGDLLGAEQSGFIESVGLEMYMQILNEEINTAKFKEVEVEDSSLVRPQLSNTVEQNYIESDADRILFHKRISKIKTLDEFNSLYSELEDRYGKIEHNTYEYMIEKLFKNMIKSFGFYKIDEDNFRFRLIMNQRESECLDGRIWFSMLKGHDGFILKYETPHIVLEIKKMKKKLDLFKEIINYLEEVKSLLVIQK